MGIWVSGGSITSTNFIQFYSHSKRISPSVSSRVLVGCAVLTFIPDGCFSIVSTQHLQQKSTLAISVIP
jgi:hypothetical protein